MISVRAPWVHFVGTFAITLVLVTGLGLRPVVVAGSSMEPTLSRGDVCVVRAGREIERGDIVLIDRGRGGYVLHRVVRVLGDGFVTRGDASDANDRDVAKSSAIRGSVVMRLPLGALLGGWIQRVRGGTLHNQSHSDSDDGEAFATTSA